MPLGGTAVADISPAKRPTARLSRARLLGIPAPVVAAVLALAVGGAAWAAIALVGPKFTGAAEVQPGPIVRFGGYAAVAQPGSMIPDSACAATFPGASGGTGLGATSMQLSIGNTSNKAFPGSACKFYAGFYISGVPSFPSGTQAALTAATIGNANLSVTVLDEIPTASSLSWSGIGPIPTTWVKLNTPFTAGPLTSTNYIGVVFEVRVNDNAPAGTLLLDSTAGLAMQFV
jgi:hypothetical protein